MSGLRLLLLQIGVGLAMLLVWHLVSTYPIVGDVKTIQFFFSNPIDVAARIWKLFYTGVIWRHLGITLTETLLAFVIGSGAGIVIGFWFARQQRVAAVFDPYVKMANALPRVVLAPIFRLWFGLASGPRSLWASRWCSSSCSSTSIRA